MQFRSIQQINLTLKTSTVLDTREILPYAECKVTDVMTRLSRTALVLGVLVCFLVMSGVVSSQAAAHSLHHVHHNAATHSTILCSLMCAAGQVVSVAEPVFDTQLTVLHAIEVSISHPVTLTVPTLRFSRGPPRF